MPCKIHKENSGEKLGAVFGETMQGYAEHDVGGGNLYHGCFGGDFGLFLTRNSTLEFDCFWSVGGGIDQYMTKYVTYEPKLSPCLRCFVSAKA